MQFKGNLGKEFLRLIRSLLRNFSGHYEKLFQKIKFWEILNVAANTSNWDVPDQVLTEKQKLL